MLATFPVPILSVTAEAVRDLQGQDALYSLWTGELVVLQCILTLTFSVLSVFTKCKESVQDGRRLENISWRLWYRELIQARVSYQPPTPELVTPHPKDERSCSSYFPAHTDEKVSPTLQVLSSGLPSPSDQASPSPLPPPMPTMVPPSTPERPRISPHSPGSTAPLDSFTRGKSTPCVGRLIVDMLPNQLFIPQRKSTPVTAATAVLSTPPPSVQPSRTCDFNVPLVQLPTSAQAPFPRVVVVNPTPHPTPPTTPILHDDTPGAPQPPSTFLLPPLPPPALRPTVPSAEVHAQQQPQLPLSLTSKEPPSSHTLARVADVGSLARQSDRRFFLQQSPEDASPERGDGSTASGKSPSDLFEASSAASSQMKSVLTDAGARHPAHGRQKKPKRGKEAGKRPLVKRSHSAKHVALSMVRKLSAQQQHPQLEPAEKKGAMFNIGSGSSNGSRSANGSTGKVHVRPSSVVNGFTFTAIQPSKVTPPQTHLPVIPKGFANGHIAAGNICALNGNTSTNGNVKAHATGTVNGNQNANTHSRKTIVVASTSSEEYETTDGEDSEEWASEEMDAEDKTREAEETRLHEAALEAQRQRELFAKVPKRSYSNLNRTQSGLLSQLMNPNPAIFPPNHPYRISRSSADISRQYQQPQQRAPVPQRSTSAYAPPRLSTSKSAAALPMAAQITAISSSKPPSSSAMKRQESEKNGYRPKGPPKEQEMEDDSGDDADDKIQMSQSVAQQKLRALMSRRSSEQGTSSQIIQPVAMEAGPGLLSSTTAPIPVGHPYNLPAAAPPMTPRTTRRRMLKTELSESMRRQLLWERQVSSNTNPALVARRASQGVGGLRPLTSTSSEGIRDTSTRSAEAQDRDERRRRAMARNRSWADDYHYSGW
ncbi:hypothetical protein J3R83DRAFT_8873 [Lanmaoa asiatica]|nr:hypothetical protein J3R83DRAFT_8873 [Lanmaoa asiatica]